MMLAMVLAHLHFIIQKIRSDGIIKKMSLSKLVPRFSDSPIIILVLVESSTFNGQNFAARLRPTDSTD